MSFIQFSTEDLRTPESVERVLRQFEVAIGHNTTSVSTVMTAAKSALSGLDVAQLAEIIRAQLQATGSAPLNLQSLLPAVASGNSVLIEDNHANRLTSYPPANYTVGVCFWETDRHVLYQVQLVAGVNTWVYAAGTMYGSLGTRPVDLGVNDTAFTFVVSDGGQFTMYNWLNTEWVTTGGVQQSLTDAVTNANTDVEVLTHRSSGVPAAGFGVGLLSQMDNAANTVITASDISTRWTVATGGSETASWTVQLRSGGAALADWFQILISGIRFNVGGFFGKLIHANSADRTYTLPNFDGIAELIVAQLALTAQSAAIGSTNFAGSSTAGTYVLVYRLLDTAADITAGTIQLSVAFTDAAGSTTETSAALALTALGRTSGFVSIQTASGSIAYSTTLVGIIGTSRYALYASLIRLS